MWNNCKVYIYGNECLRQRFLINDLYVHCKLLTKICKIWYWNICARREFITSVLVKLKVRIWKLDSSVRILFLYVSDNLLNVLSKCKEHLLSMKKVFLFFFLLHLWPTCQWIKCYWNWFLKEIGYLKASISTEIWLNATNISPPLSDGQSIFFRNNFFLTNTLIYWLSKYNGGEAFCLDNWLNKLIAASLPSLYTVNIFQDWFWHHT